MGRRTRRIAVTGLVVACLSATACRSGGSGTDSGSPPSPDAVTVPGVDGTPGDAATDDAAIAAVDAEEAASRQYEMTANSLDAAVVEAADAELDTDEGTRNAEQALRRGAAGDQLWKATYLYAHQGTHVELLRPLLDEGDASIRVLAAGGLLRLGDASGFDALTAELTNTQALAGSEPAMPIGAIANIMLGNATGQDFPADLTPETQRTITQWVDAHRSTLTFTDERGWQA